MSSHYFSLLGKILALQRRIRVRPALYLVPAIFAFIAAIFEGAGMGLLVPVANAFLSRDVTFLNNVWGFRHLLSFLPQTIAGSQRNLFFMLVGLLVLSVSLKNIFRYIGQVILFCLVGRSTDNLRKELIARCLKFGKLFFDEERVGRNSTVLTQFSTQALLPLLSSDTYLGALFSVTAYLIVMTIISWQLTLFALPLLVLLNISINFLVRRIVRLSKAIAHRIGMLNGRTVEILGTIPFIQSFNMQRKEGQRYGLLSSEIASLTFRMSAVRAVIYPLQEIGVFLSILLLFSAMLFLIVKQNIGSAASFGIYFYLVLNITSKYQILTNVHAALGESSGALDAVMDILDEKQGHIVPSGSKVFAGLQHAIEIRNLDFSYNSKTRVLNDLSFSIEKGKTTAIVGATGTGKTTIIHLLLRHYDCPGNSILLDGTDIRAFTHDSIRAHLAVVSQETFLLNDTLRHNLTYGTQNISEEKLQRIIETARLQRVISRLPEGTESLIGDRGVQLSGGEKQLVSIARALLRGADIIIFDEATSALDSVTESLVQEAIKDASQNRTTVIIAHRFSTIEHAEKIVVIDNGHCIEEGNLKTLQNQNGKFAELFRKHRLI